MDIIQKYQKAFQKILKADNTLIITHVRPDGDALASLTAMTDLMKAHQKKYTAFVNDELPTNFSYLPHFKKIKTTPDFDLKQFDLVIVLDCGSVERTGLANNLKNRPESQYLIEFDHHPKIADYSNLEIRIPAAAATAEILYNFFKANNLQITKNVANSILTGILTDTGNFLFPTTSEEAVSISSEMLLYGARFPTIVRNTWQNKSLPSMKILGKAMDNLTINSKYNIGFSLLKKEDMGLMEEDENALDGVTGFLSSLYGVKMLVFLKEEDGGVIKGSLRSSHPTMDVSKLAQKLGGGGHAKSSGFIVKGNLEKVNNKWQIK